MQAFDRYVAQYNHEHSNPWNRILHAIGIALIFLGFILMIPSYWRAGLLLFVFGWPLLFLRDRIESSHSEFFQGPVHFLVDPLWVTTEIRNGLCARPCRSSAPP